MTALIETHQLSKRFGDLLAVHAVNLAVRAGEILALLGPNGAGKTTTIRMLASILSPTEGWVRIAGFDSIRDAVKVRERVGVLTEHHGLYTRMKAKEYLEFYGSLYGLRGRELSNRIDELLTLFQLVDTPDLRLGQYSKGMRQKLALSRALLHDPQVLLLDEPTSAMDPSSARIVRESIRQLRSSNRAIIVCTHNLAEAEALADRIAIIHHGHIVALGTISELKNELLGEPIMELRTHGSLDGALGAMPQELEVLAAGTNWIRYRVSDPEEINPQVLERMAVQGIKVVTLAEVGRSLEEVYLSVVEHEQK
jgi:ABC-2 type transport system ATP-binding protein